MNNGDIQAMQQTQCHESNFLILESRVFKFDARLLSDHVKAIFILYIQIVNTSIVLNQC